MAPTRRACWPNCKTPDKRDFMFINPERSTEDFYRNYDPMVGVSTVGILVLFIFIISIKSIIRCTIRRYKMWNYDRKLSELRSARQSAHPSTETVTFAQDDMQFLNSDTVNQNGKV